MAGVAEHGSLHKFAGHTNVMLQRYGLQGFAAGMLQRWVKGDITQGLKDPVLQRIGLLKGFSTDPVEAQCLAYLWLHDPNFDPISSASRTSETAATYHVGNVGEALSFVDAASAPEARRVAIAAVDRLESLTQEKAPVTVPTPVGWTDDGYRRLRRLVGATEEHFAVKLPAPDPGAVRELDGRVWVLDLGPDYEPENCLSASEVEAVGQGHALPRATEAEPLPPLTEHIQAHMAAMNISGIDGLAQATGIDRDRVRRIMAIGGWDRLTEDQTRNAGELLLLSTWRGCAHYELAKLANWDLQGPVATKQRHLNGANGLAC